MLNAVTVSWQPEQTPKELYPLLEALSEEYPIVKNDNNGIKTEFIKSD